MPNSSKVHYNFATMLTRDEIALPYVLADGLPVDANIANKIRSKLKAACYGTTPQVCVCVCERERERERESPLDVLLAGLGEEQGRASQILLRPSKQRIVVSGPR